MSCCLGIVAALFAVSADLPPAPRVLDGRLAIELIAAEPEIVTPTGVAVDAAGRILVIENNTHFRPKNYTGPSADRIRVFEDADHDGKIDKAWTLFEGTTYTMNLAVYKDGSVFVATRNEIFRLYRDAGGKLTKRDPIAHLETKGNYPHNAVSGFAFDRAGRIYFGMGENLGAPYKLIGADGSTDAASEGGHIFRINPDGSKLERIATGFWNPFHLSFDKHGQLFAVDNDPDSRPPCRLLHIVEGGDYGYRYHNGRKGLHPFTAWNGELPGTLPMVAGTGEAPSGIVAYEAAGMPADYRGELLVTSWGDHRIDRFHLAPRGASFQATGKAFIQGGENFRPVGIATAPDGSLVVSDWVDKSYDLHNKGRIWRIRAARKPEAPAATEPDPKQPPPASELGSIDESRTRQYAASDQNPIVRAAALRGIRDGALKDVLLQACEEDDPFIRQAARLAMARVFDMPSLKSLAGGDAPKRRLAALLVLRDSGNPEAREALPKLLRDADSDVRLMAIQWVGEQRLSQYRDAIQAQLVDESITPRILQSTIAALDRIDRGLRLVTDESSGEEYVAPLVTDPKYPAGIRALALRSLRPNHPTLTAKRFEELLSSSDVVLLREAVRSLRESNLPNRPELLFAMATEAAPAVRPEAIVGLPNGAEPWTNRLLRLCNADLPEVRLEALRSLRGAFLSREQKETLADVAIRAPAERELLASVLDPNQKRDDPPASDVAAWVNRLDGPADPEAGERIFFHPRGAACSRCHAVDGRGGRVGPELSAIGQTLSRERLIESILRPSKEVAPQFVSWKIALRDGTTRTGVMLGEDGGGARTFVDAQGQSFQVKRDDVEESAADTKSIMPDDLHTLMTIQEFRDVLAFLARGASAPIAKP